MPSNYGDIENMGMFNLSPLLVLILDRDGNILDANEKSVQKLGYSVEELRTKNYFDITNDYYRSTAENCLKRLVADESRLFHAEQKFDSKYGKEIWGEVDAVCFSGESDSQKKILIQIYDNTEYRMAIDELQREEVKYLTLIENSEDAIIRLALDGKVLYANQAATEIYETRYDEFVGMNLNDINRNKDAFAEFKDGMYLAESGYNQHFSEIEIKSNGKTEFFDINLIPEKNQSGEVESILFSARNITSCKMAQMEKMAIEKQYIQTQKLEALGRLAGGVAHDFNNLLTGINGYVSLAKLDLGEDDPVYSVLHEIQGATFRASDLTRQLMVFSKKQVIDPKPINLNALVQSFHKVISKMVGESIHISNNFEAQPWMINADSGQLEQVLVNLVVNSADAMKDGGEIFIETKNVTIVQDSPGNIPEGKYLMLSVTDSGIGMDKEIADHLFEPLYTTKKKGKGTGLGLFTVYGIVKQHHGYIAIESEKGVGTTVKVFIPEFQADEKPNVLFTNDEWPRGKETILIVEDEKLVRSVAKRTLIRLGYNILEATDGADSMELIQNYNGKIDMLLTDVVMPGIGGLKLAGMVGKRFPDMKIIFSSGYSEELIADKEVLKQGMNFLKKPYSPQLLANKVREVFNS